MVIALGEVAFSESLSLELSLDEDEEEDEEGGVGIVAAVLCSMVVCVICSCGLEERRIWTRC